MAEDDDTWEYNCPKFFDFSNPDAQPQVDDDEFFSAGMCTAPKDKGEDIKTLEADENERPQPTFNPPLSNICSSLDAWNRSGPSKANDSSKPKAGDKRTNGQSAGVKTGLVKRPLMHPPSQTVERGKSSLKRSRSSSSTQQREEVESPAAKSIKRSNSVKNLSGKKSFQRSNSSSDLASRKRLTRSSSSSTLQQASGSCRLTRAGSRGSLRDLSVNREKKMATLTIASSPTFMSRLRSKGAEKSQAKTSEESEMEKTAMMRKALRDKLKKNQQGYKKALAMPVMPSAAPQLTNTVVQEFNFHTDKKVKTHVMETRNEAKDFTQTLRSNSQPQQKQVPPGRLTIVQPFNLTETKKKPEENVASGVFKSMAQTIKDFHRRTPDRFRTKIKGQGSRLRSKSPPPKLTIPKTPSLMTRSRSRPVSVPSKEELEEQELEMIKQNQFKSQPVNQKIFTHGRLGLKKVESKPVTQVEEFKLTSDQRVKVNSTANKDTEDKYEFHPRPLPTKILQGVVGVKPAKKILPTVPQSPALAVKLRARLPRLQPEQEEECVAVLRRPVPHTGVPFQPHLPHKHSVVEPFQFDERDKERLAKKEERLKHLAEEQNKVRDFVATPLLESVISGETTLPPKQPKPPTIPQPFDLELDKRGKRKQEEFQQKVEEEEHHLKELTKFNAQDCSIIHKEPFVPKLTGRHLCGKLDITGIQLNTELRAKARENYEQGKKERQSYMEACQRELEMRKMEEDKEAISQMRQEMVHRANPIRHYAPMEIQACTKPVTMPLTPNFHTSRRLRSHTEHSITDSHL